MHHNSYIYDRNGKRRLEEYFVGKKIKTYGVIIIKGKKFYDLGNNRYIKVSNVSGVIRKLKHNAYIYTKKNKKAKRLGRKVLKKNKKIKRLGRKVLKKNKKVRTYGGAIKMHNKWYYIVGKNQYVKKANF
ncbi:SLAP domain-containing protein [Lactobacillus sp. IBH004]|uniref:SLAP domain-containing protein n=1 Tax=Lactobacillus sp. IBH004 TaxID=2879107 RepID=UPI002244184F|nr:SLAP domain-containing protein [Lactobacillus sp. IBH004]UZN42444.1 SLAP domain-containing protein [Lactobacillus sp. IBH004]